ncbi:MAG: hypothetical protein O7G87_17315 [bacterium]|nr:hypothetical protein [bacterium]
MNQQEMLTVLRGQADQIRRLSERLDAVEAGHDELWEAINRTQDQTNRAIRYLIQLIQDRDRDI